MQPFPRLIPSSRVFTPGDYGHTARRGKRGIVVTSSHSDAITSQSLSLSFLALKADAVTALAFHWASAKGQFGVFPLPPEIWNGVDNYSVFTPDGYLWKYTAPPDVEEVPCGLHDVSVELEMVPINASGAIVSMGIGSIRLRGLSPTISVGIIALTRSKILVRAVAPTVTVS